MRAPIATLPGDGKAQPRPKVAGFAAGMVIGKDEPERLRSPPANGIEECRASKHVTCLGGQHGYFATILAGRSTDYIADQRRDCCSAILIPLHHQGARRNAGADRHGRSADRGLCRNRAGRGGGRKIRRRGDQQEGRHSGQARRTPDRGLRQRCRHRRAEDAQADRTRSGELHHRRREFRHRDRDGAGHQREEGAPYRLRRSYRSDHRRQLLVERVPGLQFHRHGRQCHRHHADGEVRQEMVLPDAGLRVWTLGPGRLRETAEGRGRHFRRVARAPRHAGLFGLFDPGKGLRPAGADQRHGRRRPGLEPQAIRPVRPGQANGGRRHPVRA